MTNDESTKLLEVLKRHTMINDDCDKLEVCLEGMLSDNDKALVMKWLCEMNAPAKAINLSLTHDEALVLDDYVFKKLCRLKEAALDDSKCYIALEKVHAKLVIAMRNK